MLHITLWPHSTRRHWSHLKDSRLVYMLQAWNGYHSMRLNPAARNATTFITGWGRYRYLRALQGSHIAGDGYTKVYDDFTIDCPCKTKCIDDSLLWDSSIEECF